MSLHARRFCAAMALCGAAAQAEPLAGFQDIANALARGGRVTVALDLARCQRDSGQPGPAIRAGLALTSYMNFGARIVFSDSHFTLPPAQTRPVVEFVRYELDVQGGLALTSTEFELPGYVQRQKRVLRCSLGRGAAFFAS